MRRGWRRWGWGGTYPALLLSSSQLLGWSGLGWILRSRWGRATQTRRPTQSRRRERRSRRKGGRKERWGEGGGNKKRKLDLILKVRRPKVSDLSRNRERVLIVEGEIRAGRAHEEPAFPGTHEPTQTCSTAHRNTHLQLSPVKAYTEGTLLIHRAEKTLVLFTPVTAARRSLLSAAAHLPWTSLLCNLFLKTHTPHRC